MKKYLLFGLSLFLLWSVDAQERTVSGTIKDAETGDPVPGANVVEKGTTNGTITDFNGQYKLTVGENATLVLSFVGYATQEVSVGARAIVDVNMELDVTSLAEVVVVGYGAQDKKEITSSVVSLDEKSFNRGNISDPSQLLQGKVPGLSVYNKGGDPNSTSTIRLRGISTVGANTQPLVVIDGVIGASLSNIDPNDIETINVLKDGSAAAIYGSRGSSGVILVTTKSGKRGGGVSAEYNGFISAATIAREVPNMSASEYVGAGGNDLGSNTDWVDEVTRTGISQVHNISVAGGSQTTTYRLSTNFRNVDGILRKSGFDQVNARANISHYALNEKLQINFNMSLTNRESNYSFNEALRYAILFNPTAPVLNDQGNYFQAILFDNFNPVAIVEQNQNLGKKKDINFNTKIDYSITDELTVTANYAQQYGNEIKGEYYPRASLFRGYNRGGLARRSTADNEFRLFEAYATYATKLDKINLSVTGGYSFQEEQSEDFYLQLGNFPTDALGFNILEASGDLLSGISGASGVDIQSNVSPAARIIAFFGRANLTFDNAIFFNASIRREGSTKLGEDNQWGIFPAVGLGVDVLKYVDLGPFNAMKLRGGYGVTGSLPANNGLAQDLYTYSNQSGGSVGFTRAGNPDLKWEEKAEINLGLDFGMSKFTGSLDVYTRTISDFILERTVDAAVFGTDRQFQNAGELKTNGIELALNYQAIENAELSYNTGLVLSSYNTTLEKFIVDEQVRANLGAPGQNSTNLIRVKVGEEIGQIWGPEFDYVNDAGAPVMKDLNGDGVINSAQGSALAADGDFKELGNGIPDLELGWTNVVTYKNWELNAFFRGAFGHSLINTYRAFYEPIDPGAINSYNRIDSDKAVDGLTVSQFSSLYVEKANFLRLDNVTLAYNFDVKDSKAFRSIRAYFNIQNAFTITDYSGIDPEPVLQDFGPVDNGNRLGTTPDVLSPGIDRRNNYFTARTFTFGVNVGF